jgi:acyl carrier protein
MAASDESITFKDVDPLDIIDVIIKLEKSFGLKLEKDAFAQAKTFGELCDVFDQHINYEHRNDCTSQQAFYKVREAIATVQEIDISQISPDTNLADVFPQSDRKQKVKEFKTLVNIKIRILTYPTWLKTTVGIAVLLSLVAFFFDWKVALSGLAFCILLHKVAQMLGTDLIHQTVRELVEQLSKEHYIDVRRTKGTINRMEVSKIIIETFSNDLSIDKNELTKEAKLI